MASHNTINEEGSARAKTSAATLNFGGMTELRPPTASKSPKARSGEMTVQLRVINGTLT